MKKKKKQKSSNKIVDSINYLFIYACLKHRVNNVNTKINIDGVFIEKTLDNQPITRIMLEGGSRSGKSFAVCCFICDYVIKNKGKRIAIYRDTFYNCKTTIYRTLETVWGLYGLSGGHFNKTASDIHYNGNTISFEGSLDPSKSLGRENDLIYFNELIEIPKHSFDQIEQRIAKNGICICDYNPSTPESYVYDLSNGKQTKTIHTTILNNPDPSDGSKAKILSYEPTEENIEQGTADANKWNIYGLGKRGVGEELIYPNWGYFEEHEKPKTYDYKIYGLDLGNVNDPMAFVEVIVKGNERWVTELLYQSNLTNSECADIISNMNIDKSCYIVTDINKVAVREFQIKGLNCIPAVKPRVIDRIAECRKLKVYMNKNSFHLDHEHKKYKWAKHKLTDEIIMIPAKKQGRDQLNHLLDAFGYSEVAFYDN